MKVCAVQTTCPSNVVQKRWVVSRNDYVRLNNEEPTKSDSVSFKAKLRWGGAIGGTLGTGVGVLAGIGLTVLTGGIAAPFIGAVVGGGAGAMAGDMIDHAIDPKEDDD